MRRGIYKFIVSAFMLTVNILQIYDFSLPLALVLVRTLRVQIHNVSTLSLSINNNICKAWLQ